MFMKIWGEDGFLDEDFSVKVDFKQRAMEPFWEMTTSDSISLVVLL